MLTLPPSTRIYMATARIDGRKGIDALANHVRNEFHRDPFDGHLFVFFSRRADRARLLHWDHNGYVLILKRLEKGTFHVPAVPAEGTCQTVEAADLMLILQGIDLSGARRRPRWDPPSTPR